MNPNDAARALLSSIPLPKGTVNVLPWPSGSSVVMRVYVDRSYIRHAQIPAKFDGYDVFVEEKHITTAH